MDKNRVNETGKTPFDRCIRNERKIEILDFKMDAFNDKFIRLDIKLDQVIMNELKHKANIEQVFTKKPRDLAILITFITAVSAIIVSIIQIIPSLLRGGG